MLSGAVDVRLAADLGLIDIKSQPKPSRLAIN